MSVCVFPWTRKENEKKRKFGQNLSALTSAFVFCFFFVAGQKAWLRRARTVSRIRASARDRRARPLASAPRRPTDAAPTVRRWRRRRRTARPRRWTHRYATSTLMIVIDYIGHPWGQQLLPQKERQTTDADANFLKNSARRYSIGLMDMLIMIKLHFIPKEILTAFLPPPGIISFHWHLLVFLGFRHSLVGFLWNRGVFLGFHWAYLLVGLRVCWDQRFRNRFDRRPGCGMFGNVSAQMFCRRRVCRLSLKKSSSDCVWQPEKETLKSP